MSTQPYIPNYTQPPTVTYYTDDPSGEIVYIINFPPPSSTEEWSSFFKQIQITEQNYSDYEGYYNSLFKEYWREFSIKNGSTANNTMSSDTAASPTVNTITMTNDTNNVNTEWTQYLEESTLTERVWSPFMWMFKILLEILPAIQQASLNNTNYSAVLTNAQVSATSSMGVVAYDIPPEGTLTIGSSGTQYNQQKQLELQLYLGWQGVVQAKQTISDNNLNTSNQAYSQTNTLMTSLIQQMQSILSVLFT
jgi:hypothetical protein